MILEVRPTVCVVRASLGHHSLQARCSSASAIALHVPVDVLSLPACLREGFGNSRRVRLLLSLSTPARTPQLPRVPSGFWYPCARQLAISGRLRWELFGRCRARGSWHLPVSAPRFEVLNPWCLMRYHMNDERRNGAGTGGGTNLGLSSIGASCFESACNFPEAVFRFSLLGWGMNRA